MNYYDRAALARIRSEEIVQQARAARDAGPVVDQRRAEQTPGLRRAAAVFVATVRRQLPSRA